MARLKMLADMVLVRPDAELEAVDSNPEVARIVKEGLIVIPDAYIGGLKKTPMRGELLQVGPDMKLKFDVGQHVIYTRFGGSKFTWQDEQLLMLRENELLAVECD